MKTMTADEIRAAMKTGKKHFVIASNGGFRDLTRETAARMEGQFQVQETQFEIIVNDNYQRRRE